MIRNKLKTFLSFLCIILSFFILDFGYRGLLDSEINYYGVLNISPIFFTLSYISLFICIYCLLNSNLRKIIYVSTIIMFSMIMIIEYKQLDFNIIMISLVSLLICLFDILYLKDNFNLDNGYKYLQVILGSLISFILFRGIAIYSLGPEVVRTSKKIDDSPKNVYLYDVSQKKKQIVSGLYEYTFRDLHKCLGEELNKNIKRINNKY